MRLIGTMDEEIARVRALRANPPGLAANDDDRRRVFAAALEQFEQLLRSAEASPPTTSPLSLFYALSQAGRAIAAARLTDPARWDYAGHGISGPDGKYPTAIGAAGLTPHKSGKSAFRVVAEATGSPIRTEDCLPLAELWASLPETQVGDGLGSGLPRALLVHHTTAPISPRAHLTIPGAPHGKDAVRRQTVRPMIQAHPEAQAWFDDLIARYPRASGLSFRLVDATETTVSAEFEVPIHHNRPALQNVAETYLGESTFYVRPSVGGTEAPSVLMTWWAVLFALSQLVRYEPAAWAANIAPDSSALTVPLEDGLRLACLVMPQLVYHGLTGAWSQL
jgi:hypothetical protein